MALDYRSESVRKPTLNLVLVPRRLFAADVISQDSESDRASMNLGTSPYCGALSTRLAGAAAYPGAVYARAARR